MTKDVFLEMYTNDEEFRDAPSNAISDAINGRRSGKTSCVRLLPPTKEEVNAR